MARKRLFFGGSRQAPDPYDQFLEERGFYRKHTARDASCLFRVVSEQLYHTQLNHTPVRQECVRYMKRNAKDFVGNVPKSLNVYLEELSESKTFGTCLELKALAYRFKCKVLLFEPFNVGHWFVNESHFKKCFKIFFTPEKHFDSIYDNDYIEDLAYGQGLCYEILYREVFNLPDIMYAVERMLHDPMENNMQYKRKIYNNSKCDFVVTSEGREFVFDRPECTSCILDNYELCHFHNKDFALFANNLKREAEMCKNNSDRYKINRKLESLLPDKSLSCVRQLLNEGITPFPYKVAKGLDTDIYRNIEFDAWSDFRKYKRIQYTTNRLQVGLKCHVRLHGSTSSLYNCHIQEMNGDNGPCLVYVEELGEKKMVPYGRLEISDKRTRWDNIPYRVKKNHINKNVEMDGGKPSYQKMHRDLRRSNPYYHDSRYYHEDVEDGYMAMKEYNNFRNFVAPPPYEFITMPLARENSYKKGSIGELKHKQCEKHAQITEKKDDELEEINPNSDVYSNCDSPYGYYEQGLPFPYDPNIPPPAQVPPPYMQAVSTPNYNHGYYCQQYNTVYSTTGQANATSNSMYSIPPPANPINGTYVTATQSPDILFIPIKRKELLQTTLPINFGINPSYNPTGHDIPVQDMVSVRFFYNLGHEYFKHIYSAVGMSGVSNLIQGYFVPNPTYEPLVEVNAEVKLLTNEIQHNFTLKDTENISQPPQQQSQSSGKQDSTPVHSGGGGGRRYNRNNHNAISKKDMKSPHPTKHVSSSAHKNNKSPAKKDTKDPTISPIQANQPQVQADLNLVEYVPNATYEKTDEHGQTEYFQYIPSYPYQYPPYNTYSDNVAYVMQSPYVTTAYAAPMSQQNVEPYGYASYDNSQQAAIMDNSGGYTYPTIMYQTPMNARPQPGQLWYPPQYAAYVPMPQQPLVIPGTGTYSNTSINVSSISQ